MKFCPKCGFELNEGAKFCQKCGFQLAISTEESPKENTPEKGKIHFDKIKVDEPLVLELKEVKGMNVTRAKIKNEAQKKLSGRYGEWFKSIMWISIATFSATFMLTFSTTKLTSTLLSIAFISYSDPTLVFLVFFWFLAGMASIIAFLLIYCFTNAIMQWCAIFTLKGQQADGISIFSYFVRAQKNRILKANILISLYTFLWSLLFIVPGIVKFASYAMTNYILEKRPELTASEAISLSRNIMHGYKLEYLILHISFFFWFLSSSLSMGLSNFYVLPYLNVTQIIFLDLLYKHYEAKQI